MGSHSGGDTREAPASAGPTQNDVSACVGGSSCETRTGAPAVPEAPRGAAVCRTNIRMMMVFQLVNAMSMAAAFGPIFDKFLYYLGGGAAQGPWISPAHGHQARNSLVGFAESISGLSSVCLAIPVGLLVDRAPDRRARLLYFSVVFAVAASVVGVIAVLTDYVILVFLALFLLGAFNELSSSTSEAIFADSIPQGERVGLFTTKSILSSIGVACGPLLSGICLEFLGDQWRPAEMKILIISGIVLLPISCLALLRFGDPPAAQAESRSLSAASQPSTSDTTRPTLDHVRCGPFRERHIPFLLATSDFITCIGAGMTVKFFNLFFIQDEHFSPTHICWLQSAYPLVIAVFMKGTERLAKFLGRAQASLLFFSSSVMCLCLLSRLQGTAILVTVFLLRGGFANSTYPIDRSILMDYTPSAQRGRWNAVASFTSMTWSGSAFLGGLLSDAHDYRYTFLITALVYAVGCISYLPLLALVPRGRSPRPEQASDPSGLGDVPLMHAAVLPAASAEEHRAKSSASSEQQA